MTAVIVEAAINGTTTKQRNPHVPRQPEEIAEDALACFAAGAAIVHNHVDKVMVPGPEAAARYLEGWAPVLAARPDALLYPTTNFGPDVTGAYSHMEPLTETARLRIGIIDPGSVNLGGVADDGLPAAPGFVYANSFGDIRYQAELCERLALGPSMAIFEPGWLRAALAWHRAGRLPRGAMVKLYFGGEQRLPDDRVRARRRAVRPAADAAGPRRVRRAAGRRRPAVVGGGHRRRPPGLARRAGRARARRAPPRRPRGLRRSPHAPRTRSSSREAVALCEDVGRPVAGCDEAAAILDLPRPRPDDPGDGA